jgi:hypothetical protein
VEEGKFGERFAAGLVIERFEGEIAVCERPDRTSVDIPRAELPEGAKQGDVLRLRGGRLEVDHEETEKQARKIKDMMDRLWEK